MGEDVSDVCEVEGVEAARLHRQLRLGVGEFGGEGVSLASLVGDVVSELGEERGHPLGGGGWRSRLRGGRGVEGEGGRTGLE